MSSLTAVNATPELATFPPVSRAILALAFDDGRPLRPVTVDTDRTVLLRAEHLVRRERLLGREALARARGDELELATLRGILRFARSLLEEDDVAVRVHELTRRQVVDEAFRLFARTAAPLEELDVELFKEMFNASEGAVELDEPGDPLGEDWGPVIGLCARCGDVVRAGDEKHPSTLAVFDRALIVPAWRLAWTTDKTDIMRKPTKLASMLLEGEAPSLCNGCAVRWKVGLLTTEDLPDPDDDVAVVDLEARSARATLGAGMSLDAFLGARVRR